MPRYAQQLIKAAEWSNAQHAAHLDGVADATTLFLLSADATPEDVREWFMARAAAGDVPTRAEVAERKRGCLFCPIHRGRPQAIASDFTTVPLGTVVTGSDFRSNPYNNSHKLRLPSLTRTPLQSAAHCAINVVGRRCVNTPTRDRSNPVS